MNSSPSIENIIDHIFDWSFGFYMTSSIRNKLNNGLFWGRGGMLLFVLYYKKYRNNIESQKVESFIEAIIEDFLGSLETQQNMNMSYGISGFAWALDHLYKEGFIEISEEFLRELDNQVFLEIKEKDPSDFDPDFLHGDLGMLFYLIERNFPKQHIAEAIDLLFNSMQEVSPGLYLWVEEKVEGELTCYTGLAHGLASIFAVIGKAIHTYGVDIIADYKDRIDPAMAFMESLWDQEAPGIPSKIIFKNGIEEKGNSLDWRWCHGAIGVALAIHDFFRETGSLKAEERSSMMLEQLIQKGPFMFDEYPGICHGSLSPVIFFYGINHTLKHHIGEEVKKTWIQHTIEKYYNSGSGNAKGGFDFFRSEVQGNMFEGPQKEGNLLSLLDGLPGIGLVLISEVSDIEPLWLRSILLR